MKTLIFELSVSHQYYQQSYGQTDNYINDYPLMLVPDEQSQNFINRYQLLTLQTNGYFALYHMGNGGAAAGERFNQALGTLLEQQPVVLNLESNDPNFLTISDVPVDWYGLMGYSSNNIGAGVPAPMTQTLQGPVSPMGGKAGNKVATVSIYPDSLSHNRQYGITIAARQTHWHYYVFNRSKLQLDDPLITNQQGLEFDNAGEVTLQDGEQAILFKSPGAPLPLQGSAQTRFDLLNLMSPISTASISTSKTSGKTVNKLANSKVLVKGLPIPPTNRIDVTDLNGQPYVYSQMYVYL